jgi:hypothetical protein
VARGIKRYLLVCEGLSRAATSSEEERGGRGWEGRGHYLLEGGGMALRGKAAKLLEEQLHGLHDDYPQCDVREEQYKATVRHTLPGYHILTLELQLQPEFKAFVTKLQQPASGVMLYPDQLRHPWLGAHGEIDQRAYEQKLGVRVTWRRNDDLRRVVRTILDEFGQNPPVSAAVGVAGGPLAQAPLPTYNQAWAPPPSYSQAPPAYTALHQPQQQPPAVQPLTVPTMPSASMQAASTGAQSSAGPHSGMPGQVTAAPTLAPPAHAEMPLVPTRLAEPPPGLGSRPVLGGASGSVGIGSLEPLRPSLSPPIETVPSASIPLVDVIPSAGDNSEDAPHAVELPPATRSPRNAAPDAGTGPSANFYANTSTSPSASFGARAGIVSRAAVGEGDEAALQQIKAANVEAAKANLDRREELAAAQQDVERLRAKMATVELERQRLIAEYEKVMATCVHQPHTSQLRSCVP